MTEYKLKKDFEEFFEFRARANKTAFKDDIYMGMLPDTLRLSGYAPSDIKQAEKDGMLEKTSIKMRNGSLRTIYLYKGSKLPQDKKHPVKRLLERIRHIIKK